MGNKSKKGERRKVGSKPKKTDTYEHIEEEEQILKGILTPLTKINGYKAAIIVTYSGEILASDSLEKGINLHDIGLVFNGIFRSFHGASEKIGFGACLETSFISSKGIIIMKSSGVEVLAHFHLIAILSSDGNQALSRIELDKMIPLIMNVIA